MRHRERLPLLLLLLLLQLCGASCGAPEPGRDARPIDGAPVGETPIQTPDVSGSPLDGGGGDRSLRDLGAPPRDTSLADGLSPGLCSAAAPVLLQEVATGLPDFVALFNPGVAPLDLSGFQIEMQGIGPVSYTFPPGQTIEAQTLLYLFEYQSGGPEDINTGDNIPFYDSLDANAVALRDATGKLVDFVAIGETLVGLPAGATAAAIPWPPGFNPKQQSFQRVGQSGACPGFLAADWEVKPITRP